MNKKNLNIILSICFILFSFSFISCVRLTKIPKTDSTQTSQTSQSSQTPQTEKTGWNDSDVAQYAVYVNSLMKNAGYAGFWWDCNGIIDRNNLTCRQQIIDAIMSQYPDEEFSYSKTTKGFVEESAATAVHNMKTGWNLGNTLDSTSYDWKKEGTGEIGWILQWGEKDSDGKVTVKAFETAWGMPQTTREIIHYVKECGFGAVRVPVTWAEHLDADNNVDPKWMARVHEVVDYVIDEGMYCIINTHHDGWVCASENMYNKYNQRFSKLWTQIANEFIDYDERLLFASMNEVIDENDSWNPPAGSAVYQCINKWNQLFIDTVRATGGNNTKRNLVISPRGCSGTEQDMKIMNQISDSAKNHLIIEVHNYTPQGFCFTDATWTKMTAEWKPTIHERDLTKDFEAYQKWTKTLGLPVIIGEYAAFSKKYEDYK